MPAGSGHCRSHRVRNVGREHIRLYSVPRSISASDPVPDIQLPAGLHASDGSVSASGCFSTASTYSGASSL